MGTKNWGRRADGEVMPLGPADADEGMYFRDEIARAAAQRHALRRCLNNALPRELAIELCWALRKLLTVLVLGMGYGTVAGCAAPAMIDMAKAPPVAWERLGRGEPQDLIVEFDASAVREEETRLRQKASGAAQDEVILRFKATQYAALKKNALSAMPAGEVVILRDYDMLPLMFLRFRSQGALQTFLAQPAVLRAYEDRQESLMLQQPGR